LHLLRQLIVNGVSARRTRAWLSMGGATVRCSLGRAGRRVIKREGDGATPVGTWTPVAVFYRADRMTRPRTALPVCALRPADGWCDAIGDRNYNRQVRHPYPASAERLWRQDRIYDIIVVLNHNRVPRVQGAGSAIFLHLARPEFAPTEGCIALGLRDLRLILAQSSKRTRLKIPA
jgi:L,D-peptidoglycan transpeptidase YkuD (ErfK/YbiS/YcfS/YnhG family)